MLILSILACTFTHEIKDTATDTGVEPPEPEGCVYELGLWCYNSESEEGPSQLAPADCADPVFDDLLAETGAWHGRCETAEGTLDLVNQPTGYGGPSWYFDADGDFVAYTYATDINIFCDGQAFQVNYGSDPECESICVVSGDPGYATYPACP